MQIELVGCTNAGKTTIAAQIVASGRSQGIEVLRDDEFLLVQFHLNWLPGKRMRILAANLLSVAACFLHWRRNRQFTHFALRQIRQQRLKWHEKAYLARVVLKKIGTYSVIQRGSTPEQIVLVDEGTLLVANNLFVHCSIQRDRNQLAEFAELVPLPDLAVYVKQHEPVLVTRTMQRGHKRIPDRSHVHVRTFVRRAVDLFDQLTHHPVLRDRLLLVEPTRHVVVPKSSLANPHLARALPVFRGGLEPDNETSNELEYQCTQ